MIVHLRESITKKIIPVIGGVPWFPILFSIGVILRISGFTTGVLWYDELFSLEMTHQNLFEMINALRANLSPPGLETLLWFIVRIFGWNAFSLRLPSVIASIATLWIMYKIGITLKFTREQLIAAMAVVALLPFQLITAQQGRVYALFTMVYLLGIYAAISKRWIVLGISAAVLFWCHNISFIFVPALFIIALFTHPQNWKRVILIFFFSVLLYTPWLRVTLSQAATPLSGFPALNFNKFISYFLIALLGYNMPGVVTIIVSVVLLFAFIEIIFFPLGRWIYRDMRKDILGLKAVRIDLRKWIANLYENSTKAGNTLLQLQSKWILFFAFAIPIALFLLAGLFVQSVVIVRTIAPFIIPFVMWLIANIIVPRPDPLRKIISLAGAFILIIGVICWSPSQSGGDIEGLKNIVSRSSMPGFGTVSPSENSFQPGDAFFHDTGWTAIVFKYYFPDKPNYLIDGNDVLGLGDVKLTNVQIQQTAPEKISVQRLWVVLAKSDLIEKINKTAETRTSLLILKYNCPLITNFYYSETFNIEVYLCDLHQG